MITPVVVFVYNRAEHTKRLIESLKENTLAAQSDLIIFSDGYKGEKDKGAVLKVRDYIHTLPGDSGFRKVTILESPENNGLAKSVIQGTTKVLREYGRIIVLEDDLVVSSRFLNFMNEALDRYQNDRRIWSVSGFSRDIDYLRSADVDMYFSVRAQSWSWATWSDRWDNIDWGVSDYRQFKWDFSARRRFNVGGDDMASMLDRQQCGKINSWAIRFCYAQFKNESYTVQPRVTLVQNSGQDGSGTNCNFVREFAQLSEQTKWEFREPNPDAKINMELKQTRKKIPWWKLLGSYVIFVLFRGWPGTKRR